MNLEELNPLTIHDLGHKIKSSTYSKVLELASSLKQGTAIYCLTDSPIIVPQYCFTILHCTIPMREFMEGCLSSDLIVKPHIRTRTSYLLVNQLLDKYFEKK